MPRLLALLATAAVIVVGCGDPAVDLDPPDRGGGYVLDAAGVLDRTVGERLEGLSQRSGLDVVALAFTDERASLGQADRGGRMLLRQWGADVVLVAVARPGDFDSDDLDARRRFFGVYAEDRFTVTRSLREAIVEEAVPAPASENDWRGAFHAAIDVLDAELRGTDA